MHILVASTLWLLWIIMLWIFMYKFLGGRVFSTVLGIYLEVELLNHMASLCKTFWRTAKWVSKPLSPFIPKSNVWGFQSCHILVNTCYCPFLITIPIIPAWFWFVFSYWLMTWSIFSYAFGSFVHLLWKKCLLDSFVHILIGLSSFRITSSVCFLDKSHLSGIWYASSLPFCVCFFTSLIMSFEAQKFFILMKSNLSLFSLVT